MPILTPSFCCAPSQSRCPPSVLIVALHHKHCEAILAVLQERGGPILHAALKTDQLGVAGNLKGKALTTGDKHIPLQNRPATIAAATGWWLCRGAHGEQYCYQKARWRGEDAECPGAPSDLAGSKRHLTFPALKEYDSREAEGENRESSKMGSKRQETKATQSAGCHQNS